MFVIASRYVRKLRSKNVKVSSRPVGYILYISKM